MGQVYEAFGEKPVNKTLVELLTAPGLLSGDGYCNIVGVDIITVGSDRWNEHLQKKREQLGKFSPDELEDQLQRYAASFSSVATITEANGLRAIAYFVCMRNGAYAPKRVILDSTTGLVAEITPEIRRIDIFNAENRKKNYSNAMDNWGLHARKFGKEYRYAGTLQDTLTEFSGYNFRIWTMQWTPEFLNNGEPAIRIKLKPAIAPFETVLRIAAAGAA